MGTPATVERFLTQQRVPYTTFAHRPAFTAQMEAAVTHIPGRDWAKVVVCFADQEPVLAVLPAPMAVDLDQLRQLTGARTLRLATEREMEGLYPDCEVGAMPPFGPLYDQRVFVDESLTHEGEIAFNAGTHEDAIRMDYADLAEIVKPTVGKFGKRPDA